MKYLNKYLTAIDPCEMENMDGKALIVGKKYKVLTENETEIEINSELHTVHVFDKESLSEYFSIKSDKKKMPLEVPFVRKNLDELLVGNITFSRFVDILNKEVKKNM